MALFNYLCVINVKNIPAFPMRFNFYWVLALSFFFAFNTQAQEILENNSPSLHWKQVDAPHFRVIYPEGFESEAQRLANTLETIREPESMGNKAPRKISVVLRNRDATSNAFVALAPRRSEFFTMPPQNYNFVGTNRWLDLLALHEYRHIAQFQHSKTGFTKIASVLFGQNTQSGFAFSAVPQWFWEGDATTLETLNSQSGRGRIPEFSRVFKSNLLDKKKYNYNKQHLRSFKDYIPDHYKLGYQFVTYLRRQTDDPDIWDKVTHDAFGLPFIPFTFSNALKKHTGHYLVDNYDRMMDDLKQQWKEKIDDLSPSEFEKINTGVEKKAFTDYSYPQLLEDGSIVVLKEGLGDVSQLVRLDQNGKEVDKHITGPMNFTGMLSASHFKVVWNEYAYDSRWRAKTYSVIKSYDFATKEEKTITKKSRYNGAAISPDGYQIATTLNTVNNENYVVILDTYSGEEKTRFDNPDNSYYGMVRWSSDGQKLVGLKTNEKGKSVVLIDVNTGQEKVLIPPSQENIGYPVLTADYLFYNSPYNGIDNIYAVDRNTGQRYQVTKSRLGAYNPQLSIDEQFIIYNEHTADGFDVVQAPINTDNWVPLADVADRHITTYQPLVDQEGHADILKQVPGNTYPTKKYSQLGHAINVHSWGPYATTEINKLTFGVFSQDVMSTTAINLGYTYDLEEGTSYATAGISYQGLYPIIDFNVERGDRSANGQFFDANDSLNNVDFKWKETVIEGGLRVPWLFTRNKYHTALTLGDKIRVTRVTDFSNNIDGEGRVINVTDSTGVIFRDELDNGSLINNVLSISFSRLLRTSKRDILPQWGQYLNIEHWSSPFVGDLKSNLIALRSGIFFPSPLQLISKSVFKHHSLNFRYSFQHFNYKITNDFYVPRNRIAKPRGFSYPTDEDFNYLATNYTFPLVYPDIAVGPLLNIQRVKCNLFFDYGYGTFDLRPDIDFLRTVVYKSFGAEVTVDFNVMRFSPLLNMGVRYTYNMSSPYESAGNNFELIIGNIGL